MSRLDEILKAIYTLLSSDTELSNQVKGIYFAKFPETEFPIIVINHINSNARNYLTGDVYVEEHYIQINIYSTSSSAIEAVNIAERVMMLMDNAKLDENTIGCERVFQSLIPINEIWNFVVRYKILTFALR